MELRRWEAILPRQTNEKKQKDTPMVVFFDIDGTIIDNATMTIPASAVQAISALRQNGHVPVVNTGRPFSHIDPRVRALDFARWICGCGMHVIQNGQTIFRAEPDLALCRFIEEKARQCHVIPLYEADDGSIVLDPEGPEHPMIQREEQQMLANGFRVANVKDHSQFLKFITYTNAQSDLHSFVEAVSPWFSPIYRENGMLEYVYNGCTKASGMQHMLDHLGLTKFQSMAIGDSTNDLPMFEAAEITVCMGNGMEELKQAAQYITAPLLEDGIAKALRHFGLIP